VTVEVNKENVATIRGGASLFKLPGMSEKKSPRIAEFTGPPLFSIPQGSFRGMLRRTSFAASRDTAREVLAGVCFSLAGKRLTLAATDGKRLSRDSYEVTATDGSSMAVIVPIRSVQELEKRLEDKGDALIFRSESHIGFKIKNDLVISSVVEGRFPDYEGIIPKSFAARAVLDREKFTVLVRQASLVTTAESNAAILSFSRDNLVITARTPALGEATVAMLVKYEGKPLDISFNLTYLGDVLNAMDEKEITLELNDAGSAATIKGAGNFLHVVMPMRLPDEG
jgi:DNA polymerase-3 subunit beta